ncbi:MAG: hypothetical protein WCG20_00110 [bacterium]
MTIQELIQKITDSVLSESAKKQIIDLAGTYSEVTPDLEDQVKALIQEDIDRDLAALGADENSPEIQAVQAELEAGLAEVDAELDQDMTYVDQELKELDAMRLEITRAEEALKIEQLRNDLTAGS